MTKKNIQCSVAGLGRTKALRAQGRHWFDGVTSSGTSQGRRHHRLEEDGSVVGPGTARVDGIVGSGTTWGAHRHELGKDDGVAGLGMASQAWGRRLRGRWRHRLGSGKMTAHKGARPWSKTTTWRL
jgi:hypothetical protein